MTPVLPEIVAVTQPVKTGKYASKTNVLHVNPAQNVHKVKSAQRELVPRVTVRSMPIVRSLAKSVKRTTVLLVQQTRNVEQQSSV